MRTLLLCEDITVYNEDGLFARLFKVGETVRGKYDPLIGGYACTEGGITFVVFREEAVVC